VVTFVFAVLAVAIRRFRVRSPSVRYVMFGGFVLFVVLKGSAPGGVGARADFEAAKVAARTQESASVTAVNHEKAGTVS
jgi:hypothetical protein